MRKIFGSRKEAKVDQQAPGSVTIEATVDNCGRRKEKPVIIGGILKCTRKSDGRGAFPNNADVDMVKAPHQFRCRATECQFFDTLSTAKAEYDEIRIGGE